MMQMEKANAEAALQQVMHQSSVTITIEDVSTILDLDPVELNRQIVSNRAAVGFPVCVLEVGGEVRIPRGAFIAWLLGSTQIVGRTFALLTGVSPSEARSREWW